MSFFKGIKEIFTKKEQNNVYEKGLEKSRDSLTNSLNKLTKKYKFINDDYFFDLEDILIMADVGINTVFKFMDKLKLRVKSENITSTEHLTEIIIDELFITYVSNDVISTNLVFNENGPSVFLFIGVNGVGKTTTIAKMAKKYTDLNKKVLCIAADTFRAGAIEQLKNWGEKLNVDVFSSTSTDPSAVIYEGLEKAVSQNYDLILVDTAGRLQNKVNLMKELEKINAVVNKIIPNTPNETLLVLDATTGQNGISQAKNFMEVTNITGIILTKLDGSAKGGIILAIKDEINIPVKYIGLGEKEDDLVPFDIEQYIYSLFKDIN